MKIMLLADLDLFLRCISVTQVKLSLFTQVLFSFQFEVLVLSISFSWIDKLLPNYISKRNIVYDSLIG